MMYAPLVECAVVKKVFAGYCRARFELLARYDELSSQVRIWGGSNLSEYHFWVCDALGVAFDNAKGREFIFGKRKFNGPVVFDSLGIEKIYYSSHYNCATSVDKLAFARAAMIKTVTLTAAILPPLPRAIHAGDLKSLESLVKNKVIDVNQRSILWQSYGETALHFAVRENNLSAVKLLLILGIDYQLTGEYQDPKIKGVLTAEQVACQLGYSDITDAIKAHHLSVTAANKAVNALSSSEAKQGEAQSNAASAAGGAAAVAASQVKKGLPIKPAPLLSEAVHATMWGHSQQNMPVVAVVIQPTRKLGQ